MGIKCRLRGVEMAARALGDVPWILTERVRAVAISLPATFDGCCELRVAEWKHGGARTGPEPVAARSRDVEQISIVLVRMSRKLCMEALNCEWAAQRWNNARRHAEYRICTEGMTG